MVSCAGSRGACSCKRNDPRVRAHDQRLDTIGDTCGGWGWCWTTPQPSRHCERTTATVQGRRRLFWSSRGRQRGGHGRCSCMCMHVGPGFVVLRVSQSRFGAGVAVRVSLLLYCVLLTVGSQAGAELGRALLEHLARSASFTGSTRFRRQSQKLRGPPRRSSSRWL